MKNIFIFLALMGTTFSFTACEKDMDTYEFSDPKPAYVEIKSKAAITVEEGKEAEITFQSREAFQEVKSLQYEIKGAYTITGSIDYPRNSTSYVYSLAVPDGIVPEGTESAAATFTLVSADDLTVGYKGADKEVVNITITAAE
ncbi:hypothetical protein GCM10023188_24050 [Pontibacter saemangeumensis]|uniref:DUF1735 domain-containing protein n=1 Tax=Pontibacter saemangeumensis TaxID=1084525 RepID=A0ABP8LRN2_9BACT